MNPVHEPVMTEEIVAQLQGPLQAGSRAGAAAAPGCIVDGTLGLGGHAEQLLARLAPDGRLIGLDRDAQMLAHAERRLGAHGDRFVAVRARIAYVADVVRGLDLEPVDGILFDLGLCSAQLDDPERGFSFRTASAPLDMRMNRQHGETAAELLDRAPQAELVAILRAGDVPSAGRVARALLDARPIRTVGELRDVLEGLRLPRRRHHFATLVFQALRMHVNRELDEVESALQAALEVLRPGGRLAVLSYHSGEDRRVKQFLAREARGCVCPPALPRCGCGRSPRIRIRVRGQGPEPAEVARNPRARSARLRVGERL